MKVIELICDNARFVHVCAKIIGIVSRRYNLPVSVAEDVTMTAVEYSLEALLAPRRSELATEEDFVRLVTANAKLRAIDELNRIQHCPVKGSTDEVVGCNADGDDSRDAEHPVLVRSSMEAWRSACTESESYGKAKLCWELLPVICVAAGICARDQTIYRECILEHVTVKEVSAKYKITANNLYQVCHRVGKRLAEYGPTIVEAAFNV